MRCLPTTEPAYFHTISRGLLLIIGLATISTSPLNAVEGQQKAVVELFTSQGCASCPPADALLGQLAKRGDLVALTLPVNYWDHLGWKDTLARDSYTERQRAYAASRGDHQIYTPQLVVNGMVHVVGSSAEAIEDALRRTGNVLDKVRVPMSLVYRRGEVDLHAGAAPEGSDYHAGTLWLACFTRTVPVEIRRGENNGHRVTYTNVVRFLTPAAQWSGREVSAHLAAPADAEIDGCAVFLQADESKAILGAAVTEQPTE